MAIIGFSFTKISGERLNAPDGKIEINNNATIKDVQPAEFTIGKSKQNGVRFIFQFSSMYNPSVANIELTGEVLYLDEPKKVAEILKSWKKKEKLSKELLAEVLNTAMAKSNIEALILSKELNLPPPLQLPRISESSSQASASEAKDYIG